MSQTDIIQRRSLHGELAVQLRDMMVRGELKPGDKLSEQMLCLRFGVSRTPLREALKVLAAEGLLVLSPNRGATVAKITPAEIDELFPIMGALEALAGELACERATNKDIARMESLHQAMVGHYEKGEAVPYLRLNRQIHESLFEIADNSALTQLYQTMMVRIHSVRFVAQKSPERWREAVADHEQMMQALRDRDPVRLGAILKLHLRHKAGMVHESLKQLQQETEAAK
ncbi:GntR family transcriptional regulator [Pseudochelatococcus sp. B33]